MTDKRSDNVKMSNHRARNRGYHPKPGNEGVRHVKKRSAFTGALFHNGQHPASMGKTPRGEKRPITLVKMPWENET